VEEKMGSMEVQEIATVPQTPEPKQPEPKQSNLNAEHLPWLQVAFQLRGSVIPTVLPRVFFYATLGIVVSVLDYFNSPVALPILGSIIPNVVFNLVLGLLLVFRTNTAYERFWEGRKCVETLIVAVRNLSRHLRSVSVQSPIEREEQALALRLLGVFAIVTKQHLRREPIAPELAPLIRQAQLPQTPDTPMSLEITLWISDYLQRQQQQHRLHMSQLTAMNELLDHLVAAFSGCERVLTTPMPIAYAIHLKQLMLIYCLSLPFQIVADLGWWTGLVAALVSFTLLGLEEIGIEIENPFGHDLNDLPLGEICADLRQHVERLIPTPTGLAPENIDLIPRNHG